MLRVNIRDRGIEFAVLFPVDGVLFFLLGLETAEADCARGDSGCIILLVESEKECLLTCVIELRGVEEDAILLNENLLEGVLLGGVARSCVFFSAEDSDISR